MANPLNEWQAVNDHLDNIVAYLQNLLPKRIKVDTHGGRFGEDDIKHIAIRAPALLVSVLRVQTVVANQRAAPSHFSTDVSAQHLVTADLTIGISLVTKDLRGLPRHQSAVNLAQFLAITLPGQTFGSEGAAAVGSKIDFRNLFNAKVDKEKSVNFWGCAFTQTVQFPLPEDSSAFPEKLVWSESPEIGAAHQDDYDPLGSEIVRA